MHTFGVREKGLFDSATILIRVVAALKTGVAIRQAVNGRTKLVVSLRLGLFGLQSSGRARVVQRILN